MGPPPHEGAVVRHLNDIADDNRLCNLEYGTHADNSQDAIRNGRNPQAMKSSCSRGHPLSGLNLRTRDGRRRCGACHLARQARSRYPDLTFEMQSLSDAYLEWVTRGETAPRGAVRALSIQRELQSH
ncbi:MAG: HNH endonuclease [Brevibacterium sp.]